MKICKRIAAVLMCVLLLLPLCIPAGASEPVSLSIVFMDEETPLVGAAFDIFLLATMDKQGELTVTDSFKDYPVKIEYTDDETWGLLASTLEGYVRRDGIVPTDSGVTNEQGELHLPSQGKTLPRGVYLVLAHHHEQNSIAYESMPCIAILPCVDADTHKWIYDVVLRPKSTKSDARDVVSREVHKKWEDAGFEELRPVGIVVDLLRNGEVYDTVILTGENGWYHKWENLDASFQWTVAERELKDYTAVVTREGITFYIINIWDGSIPPPPTEPPDDDTPQSGQLWWPVPVLACGGMVLVVLGLCRRRGSEDEE